MLIAALEFTDFAIIAGIVALLSGGAAAAGSRFQAGDRMRLQRVERKLGLILKELNIEDKPPTATEEWQRLACDPAQKIAAIKAYREQTGVGLYEAKQAVEAFIAGA